MRQRDSGEWIGDPYWNLMHIKKGEACMNQHDELKLSESMHYCRGNLLKGCDHKSEECVCEPIEVTDFTTKTSKTTREWTLDLYDKDGKPVRVTCKFGNTKGKIKASGARAMLEVRR